MGIGGHIVDAIAREHSYRPITGDVLIIGRQTTYFTPDDLQARLKEHGHTADAGGIEIDRTTINRLAAYQGADLVTDRSIFRALGINSVKALDISDYEGAEVIHDLNTPLPDHLKGVADFVVDGSTLDNTFNPALTLRNFAELLRPGGRLIAVNAYSIYETAYCIMPPSWYFDYFVENGFADCKVYVAVMDGQGTNTFWLNPHDLRGRQQHVHYFRSPFTMSTIVFAERGMSSSTDRLPIQQCYRDKRNWDEFLANLKQVELAERPHVARSYSDQFHQSMDQGFVWLDRRYIPHPIQ